jgi:hypothetical protein
MKPKLQGLIRSKTAKADTRSSLHLTDCISQYLSKMRQEIQEVQEYYSAAQIQEVKEYYSAA